MSEEERIRRAEEISARRSNRIPASSINSREKRKLSFLSKISIQVLASICIFGLCYFLSQNNSYAIDIIKPVISNDTDFQKLYTDINEVIKNFTKEEQKENSKNKEEDSKSEKQEQNNENKEENQEQGGVGGGEDDTQVSESEDDVTYIKKHASFIKPVEGIITSPYGPRAPTDIISANHAGVDIGTAAGTEIVASMEGIVEVSSTEGEYGNHLKITNGEISTLYAHCSELLVNEGEHVEQGKIIAKVGSTGKATGPHLHFEIRRNNVTVDPQQIIALE